jgi:hypothetical protein
MEQVPRPLCHGSESGGQQDWPQFNIATDDLLPDQQAVAGVEPTGCGSTLCAVELELAAQQLFPRNHVGRLPGTQPVPQAGRVMARAKKVREATGGGNVGRAGAQLVGADDYFPYILQ